MKVASKAVKSEESVNSLMVTWAITASGVIGYLMAEKPTKTWSDFGLWVFACIVSGIFAFIPAMLGTFLVEQYLPKRLTPSLVSRIAWASICSAAIIIGIGYLRHHGLIADDPDNDEPACERTICTD